MKTRVLAFILPSVLVVLLISSCATMARQQKAYMLGWAARRGDYAEVKRLIEEGADVNAIEWDYRCMTALMYASEEGHIEIVKLLIEEGADINAYYLCIALPDPHYNNEPEVFPSTPLMYASREGHIEIVKLLVEVGADVNFKDEEGYTALEWASRKGHTDIVKLLKEAGAKVY